MRIYLLFAIIISANAFCSAQTTAIDSLRIDTTAAFKDTLASHDTTGIFTDSTFQKADSIAPIYTSALSDKSEFITTEIIKFNDFRHTGDILNSFSFAFLQDHGSLGYPTEMFLYGSNSFDYMSDGKPVSNYSNFGGFDLNTIQSDNIDSVEILPLPRSILYNSSLVNFLYKDRLPLRPYSKIKYYQGANGEAMFNGYFSTLLYRRLYGYLDVSNRKLDRSFANTAFSSWQVTGKLKYLLSNEANINLTYNFAKQYKGLNGGIDVDSLTSGGVLNKDRMYNELLAPVNYYSQDTDEKLHNFELNILAKEFEGFSTNASVYYHFTEQSLNNIGDSLLNDMKNQSKLYGINVRQYYTGEYVRLNFNVDYNYYKNKQFWIPGSGYLNRVLGLSGIADFTITDIIKPSVFYRYNNYIDFTSRAKSLLGFDFLFDRLENISVYAGYSFNVTDTKALPLFQTKAVYKNKNIFVKGEYFRGSSFNGISGTLNYRIGSFEFESSAAQYFAENIINMPSVTAHGGFYFNDSLFYPNLLLKAGIKLTYIGKRDYIAGSSVVNIPSDYTFDFTLSGEIRRVAVVYFTWENLLDRKYYIVPYYPMYQRNIRFGVSWELFN